MSPNILRIIARFIAIIGMIILIGNFLLEILPVLPNSVVTTVSIIHRVNQQGALAERINTDAFTLVYRTGSERAQALSELQVTLPAFEKVQLGLQGGDASLNLPAHQPADVQLLLIQTQSAYTAIDTAAQTIIRNTDPTIDQNELAIIQQNDRPYFVAMSTIAKVWEGHIESGALDFFWVELIVGCVLIVLWTTFLVFNQTAQRRLL